MRFEPIAIVGRACRVPGADTPEALFALARAGRVTLTDAPAGRWRAPDADVLVAPDAPPAARLDRAWTKRGGYVESPLGGDARLDPLVHLLLVTGREALHDAGDADGTRTGAVVGNLSLPSSGLSAFAEHRWLGSLASEVMEDPRDVPVDARNAFMSGLPAHLMARGLGLGLGAYALDAACASSLYAIEHACRALQERRADRMVAGAVNRADDLFIHVGFAALGALSKSGQSRPFHADADGLVPGEGCALVVLERLDDALRAGRTVHGVIRGVGLCNDGRGQGLLAPSETGQARSMREAFAMSGLRPDAVPYVECHATGTPVGDGVELASTGAVYATGARVGSLKANLGHLITAAGAAGLIRVLECLREGVVTPTPSLDRPSEALRASKFEALREPAPWTGPRRAGVSAFGFGGNDAHLLVETLDETQRAMAGARVAVPAAAPEEVVVVALGARVGAGRSRADLEAVLFDGVPLDPRAVRTALPLGELRFPPRDLAMASGQQILLLSAALEAVRGLELAALRERTGVFVGYGCDPEIARWGGRWRAPSFARRLRGTSPEAAARWATDLQDGLVASLEAPHVIGSLPNIPANRLSSQLDLSGPSFTTSAEELSGVRALEVAVRALRRGDLDAALVGAVDFGTASVQQAARAALGLHGAGADAALCLVLRRRADAEAEGLAVLAALDLDAEPSARSFTSGLPAAHAATGLLEVAAACLSVGTGREPGGAAWSSGDRVLSLSLTALGGASASLRVRGVGAPLPPAPPPADLPVLELDVHPPPPAIPDPERSSMQAMPPAPPLPSTDAKPARPEGVPVPVPAPVPAPAALSPAPMPASPGLVPAFVAHQQAVTAAHATFLAQQTQLHAQLLGMLAGPPAMPVLAMPSPAWPSPAPALARPPVVSPPPAVPSPLATHDVGAKGAPPNPVAASAPSPAPAPSREQAQQPLALRPHGRSWSREELEVHASGRISTIFGEPFRPQDGDAIQCRMPEPPLLLADRVTGIDAQPGSMKTGTVWTETDVREDAWYLHQGHMPCGVMIESGQADLFLISYLGCDLPEVKGDDERAYRLLGCEMTWLGDLPAVGETLAYDIHVDGHATQGDVRLFFFHYDCHLKLPDGTSRPALQVRHGQAGFFTKEELADSAGILWRPEEQEIREDARVDPPRLRTKTAFTKDEVAAFAAGRPWECFGDDFFLTKTHTRTPRIQEGRMLFLGDVNVFDPTGGPWGRGYLKSVVPLAGDEWYFDGHFLNDPCMPGTLMLEGCAQAMAFYLAALGFTVDKDSWRFQPIPHETYKLLCRGQVTPASRELTYELFIEEVHEGPEPMLYADLLCTVDGLGAFHARRFGLKLTPAWPLHEVTRGTEEGRLLSEGEGDPRTALASYRGGEPFRFDYPSLLACAWGKPSAAFGPMYERFDGTRRVARLPGPPYHFLSRVTSIAGELGGMQAGSKVTFEYDVPPDAWYFGDNGAPVMPFAVLLEAALQPCGWVASFVGSALDIETDLLFRNLDGKGVILADVTPESGVFHTSVEITNISKSGGMIIESFRVRCHTRDAGGRETPIYELDTVFGFFPPEAFVDQAGLPTTEEQRALLERPANTRLDLTKRQGRLFEGGARLASGRMLMLDRVTYLDLDGGEEGLGVLRGEKDVDPGEWFFKAHFFQDPVQPGSLGLEAMLQGIQLLMLQKGAGLGWPELDDRAARFESIGTRDEHVWKYRGQVVPTNGLIGSTVELLELGRDARGPFAVARASLWVDGKRIYEAPRFGMRIVTGPSGPGDAPGGSRGPKAPEPSAAAGEGDGVDQAFVREVLLDPGKDLWIGDHRPTYTRPALPLMAIADLLVQAAREAGHAAEGLEGLEVQRWVVVDRPTRLRVEVEGDEARLLVWREAPKAALSRFERAASARIRVPEAMAPLRPLEGGRAAPLYEGDRLFHGPAFRYGVALTERAGGARLRMDAGKGAVPMGAIHPGLLDAATHAIPHDALQRWAPELGDGFVAYPRRLDLRVEGALPAHGEVIAEVRLDGLERSPERPPFARFRIDLHAGGARIAALRLTEVLLPKGPLGRAAPPARRRFLEGRVAPGVALSSREGPTTVLRHDDVAVSRWFPGVLEDVYGDARPEVIAAKEHVAAKAGAHPREVRIEHARATLARLPLTRFDLTLEPVAGAHRVTSRERLTRAPLEAFWSRHFGLGRWPVEDLYFGLVERFLGRVVVTEPDAFETLRGRPALFLANHQTGIESLLFSIVAGALLEVPALTLAKAEHRESWLGRLIAHCFSWPGASDPGVIAFFDRSDPTSLPRIAGELEDEAGARSLMVHVEGTRAERGGAPVDTMSGIWCDLALRASVPIVPVRFARGLPLEGVPEKLEYPFAMGPQDLIIGAPLRPETLAALPYKERSERVRHAINALTPELDAPQRPDPALARRVAAAMQARQVGVGLATVGEVLADLETRHPLLDALFAAQAEDGRETPAPSSGAGVEERAWLAGLSALLGFRARA